MTQYVIDHDKPDWIVNVGLCGGFMHKVKLCDVVMPTGVVQYDMDQTKFGFPLGRIHAIEKVIFPLHHIKLLKNTYTSGLCVTADKILSSKTEGKFVYNTFKPAVVDMELGSIAQVCYLNKTKLLSLKSPVDIVEKEEVLDFPSRSKLGMDRLTMALAEVIELLHT